MLLARLEMTYVQIQMESNVALPQEEISADTTFSSYNQHGRLRLRQVNTTSQSQHSRVGLALSTDRQELLR